MEHTNLVANELRNQGFEVLISGPNLIKVSLSNRQVSKMEVREALEQAFDGIEFLLHKNFDSVLVIVE